MYVARPGWGGMGRASELPLRRRLESQHGASGRLDPTGCHQLVRGGSGPQLRGLVHVITRVFTEASPAWERGKEGGAWGRGFKLQMASVAPGREGAGRPGR
jgi:hypothetical protein